MDHTPHIFLSGQQAEQFAVRQGHTLVDNSTFTTQQRKEQWQKYKDEEKLAAHDEIVQNVQNLDVTQHTQTVGAVAIDREGRLAAATSTGGRTNKWDGRIGDTPMIGAGRQSGYTCKVMTSKLGCSTATGLDNSLGISTKHGLQGMVALCSIAQQGEAQNASTPCGCCVRTHPVDKSQYVGIPPPPSELLLLLLLLLGRVAGTWADSRCAVSGTGVGEEFIRRAAAHDVAARVQYKGISLQQAMKEVVWESFSEGDGGFVGLDADYNVVMDFNSVGMYRGAVDYRGLNVTAVFQDQWADGVAV